MMRTLLQRKKRFQQLRLQEVLAFQDAFNLLNQSGVNTTMIPAVLSSCLTPSMRMCCMRNCSVSL